MSRKERSGTGKLVSKQEVKVCPLCGALGHHTQSECGLCGWHGRFEDDAAAIDYHWHCLVQQHGDVRLEHLPARDARLVGEFGVVRRNTPWHRIRAACTRRWRTFQAARDARCAERAALLRPKSALPPH